MQAKEPDELESEEVDSRDPTFVDSLISIRTNEGGRQSLSTPSRPATAPSEERGNRSKPRFTSQLRTFRETGLLFFATLPDFWPFEKHRGKEAGADPEAVSSISNVAVCRGVIWRSAKFRDAFCQCRWAIAGRKNVLRP